MGLGKYIYIYIYIQDSQMGLGRTQANLDTGLHKKEQNTEL